MVSICARSSRSCSSGDGLASSASALSKAAVSTFSDSRSLISRDEDQRPQCRNRRVVVHAQEPRSGRVQYRRTYLIFTVLLAEDALLVPTRLTAYTLKEYFLPFFRLLHL